MSTSKFFSQFALASALFCGLSLVYILALSISFPSINMSQNIHLAMLPSTF